jgi:hypothetical protein
MMRTPPARHSNGHRPKQDQAAQTLDSFAVSTSFSKNPLIHTGLLLRQAASGSDAPKTEPAAIESSETKALPPAAAGSPNVVVTNRTSP